MQLNQRHTQLSRYVLFSIIAISLTAAGWSYRQAIWLDIFNDPQLRADQMQYPCQKNNVSPTEWPIVYAP